MFKRSATVRTKNTNKGTDGHQVEGKPSLGVNVVGRGARAIVTGVTGVTDQALTTTTKVTKTTTKAVKRATKVVVTDPLAQLATNTNNVRRKIFPMAKGAVRNLTRLSKMALPKIVYSPSSGRKTGRGASSSSVSTTASDSGSLSSQKQGGPIDAPEERQYLFQELGDNFLFKDLSDSQLETVLQAFERITVKAKEVLIQEGEPGDYFYVLYRGRMYFTIGDEQVGMTQGGAAPLKPGKEDSDHPDSPLGNKNDNDDGGDDDLYEDDEEVQQKRCFGELALLTAGPRAASVVAETDAVLFRLDQINFRVILQGQGQEEDHQRIQLLKSLPVLEELDTVNLNKLVSAMTDLSYAKGDVIVDKGESMKDFFIVRTGKVEATEVTWGNATYEDMKIGPNEAQRSFGWRAMTETDSSLFGKVVALTDVHLLAIEAETFKRVLGQHKDVMERLQNKRQLKCVAVFRDSKLQNIQLDALLDLMRHEHFTRRTHLIREGTTVDATISFIRKGTVHVVSKEEDTEKTLEGGAYFGQEWMLVDQNKEVRDDLPALVKSKVTVIVEPGTDIDYLMLEDARKVVDTSMLGLGKPVIVTGIDPSIHIQDVVRHRMLGAGSFGQVWLATLKGDKEKQIYALKVQSKRQLIETSQADGVIAEINIMKCLRSQFIIRLYSTFQDHQRVYMLTSLMQGGELESIMSDKRLDDSVAQFYAAGILEGLTYMHRRHIIHRDLKPENVLINSKGYPVLIDLGFGM